MGMIKSRSIIPHPATDDSPPPTPHHSGVTGIDIVLVCDCERNAETDKELCIDALQQAQNF